MDSSHGWVVTDWAGIRKTPALDISATWISRLSLDPVPALERAAH